MADKIKPAVQKPSQAAAADVDFTPFDEALEKGQLTATVEKPTVEELLTKENLEKFLFGEITWGQLMGLTLEQAYAIAEIGYSLYEEGRYHDARTVFEGLVLSNPYDPYFHNMLGATYQQLDLTDEALEQYSIALELDQESRHAYVNRGELLLQNGQFEAALADLNAAVTLDKDGTDPAVARARALASATTTIIEGLQKLFGKDYEAKLKAKT